jgi:hypothetical protein
MPRPAESSETVHTTPGDARTDRRRFLWQATAGAGLAGAAWAAPQVSSLAYAQGSPPPCTPVTFNWSSIASSCQRITSGRVGGVGITDLWVTGTAQNGVFNNGLIYDNWSVRNATTGNIPCDINCGAAGGNYPRGNANNFYGMLMHSTNTNTCTGTGTTNRWVETTFGFFAANTSTAVSVRNLQFTLLDVDTNTNNYRDQVTLFVNGGAAAATTGAAGQATVVSIGSCVTQVAGQAVFQGTCSALAAETTANVTVKFNVPVSTVRVRFQDIRVGGPTSIQWIGISNMSWCR